MRRRRGRRHCHRRRRPPTRLHRRIFLWFGVSILAATLIVGATVGGRGDHDPSRGARAAVALTAAQLAERWGDGPALAAAVDDLAAAFSGSAVVLDVAGDPVAGAGGDCPEPIATAAIRRGDTELGELRLCADMGPTGRRVAVALGVAALMLWAGAGAIARRLVKPIGEVARVAREIGDGKLETRVTLRRPPPGEIADLAEAVNQMAARIAKQLSDQRALLAAVSHEIRTPLGHMRVLAELARDGELERLDELEREIDGVDVLVDQLLASSRLEFGSLDRRTLDAALLCARALERADVDVGLLEIEIEDSEVAGDAMLLSRALGNLLENAGRHAEAVTRVRVTGDSERIRFEVEDRGPGFADGELERVFEPFYSRGHKGDSLGLGLALVRRIADAHGGAAFAGNTDAGARVGFEIPRSAPPA